MAVRDDFSAGEVLAAADLNDTFASKVDYALPTNAQTGTTYTFVAADAEKLTTASNAAAVTLTIPPASSVAWPDNTVLRVVNYGAGAVTIDGGSGVTVTNTASTIAQYGAAVAIRTGSDAWTVVPFGGGDIPAAEVSSPAATGQYTDGSGDTWDYYTFTSSGTLTVDTAGFADVLVIAGGGSGGFYSGGAAGGGGGGGHLYITDAYLSAGTLTVTVGAGGASPITATSSPGISGNASRLDSYYSIGGGGGDGRPGQTTVGGSGGGGGSGSGVAGNGFAGTAGLGNSGGNGRAPWGGGGGGGAGAAGVNSTVNNTGGAGGAGLANSITGSSVTRAGGGGGGGQSAGGSGGTGGGGNGATTSGGSAGSANTGGGGGGRFNTVAGLAGGSGVVIVRVKV